MWRGSEWTSPEKWGGIELGFSDADYTLPSESNCEACISGYDKSDVVDNRPILVGERIGWDRLASHPR
jgi:hypothetical protein